MLKLLLLLLAGVGAYGFVRFSAWQGARSLAGNSRALADPETAAVTARLARAVGLETLNVRLLASPIVNAAASPDGRIYITDGLFAEFNRGRFTAPELASVVAHELGHVAMGHARKRAEAVALAHVLRVVLVGLVGRPSPALAMQAASFLSRLFISKLSRTDEFEADAFASGLMIKAGFGVGPQIEMLRKMGEIHPAGAASRVSWLASHPPIPERIEAIEHHARS